MRSIGIGWHWKTPYIHLQDRQIDSRQLSENCLTEAQKASEFWDVCTTYNSVNPEQSEYAYGLYTHWNPFAKGKFTASQCCCVCQPAVYYYRSILLNIQHPSKDREERRNDLVTSMSILRLSLDASHPMRVKFRSVPLPSCIYGERFPMRIPFIQVT